LRGVGDSLRDEEAGELRRGREGKTRQLGKISSTTSGSGKHGDATYSHSSYEVSSKSEKKKKRRRGNGSEKNDE